MTPQQREALKQALDQHSLKMAVKDAAPEDVAALPQDFAVPSYNENNKPLYDNQLFPAVNSVDDLVARGYATPDGQVTENGQMALSLKKVGALNDDYTLNDTGKAMMASREDLLKEENLPLYMKSKELDLDDAGELSWGEVAGNFLGELKKGGKNLIDLAGYDVSAMTPEEKASFDLQAQSAVGGLVKAGTILPMGFSQIVGNATIKAISDNEEEEKLALAQFNQKFEKKSDEINNAKTAEVVDAMGQMLGTELGMQEARQQDIQTVGAERAQELESGGESAGGVAAMFTPGGPSMLTAKVAFGVAGKGLGAAFKPISRSLLQADAKAAMVLDKTKQLATLERQAGALQLTTQAAERQAAIGESMAQKFSQAGFTDRANNALRLANQARTKGQEAAVRLGGFSDEIATVSDDLAKATQSATVADKVLQMTQKASQVPYIPITLLGKSLEYTGRGMIGIDKGLASMASKVGADKVYNAMNKITTLSGLGGVGVASGLGPAAFIPAAIKATWSTAPFIKATGEYVGLMGKEAMKARGQIGFWKRMYEMPNKGPMHRAVSGLMDTATLGGRVTGAAGRVGKGLAASYPVDLAFEWVAEGGEMNPNVLKQAAVETLVFGGTGAALGGITMGSAERIRSLQNGDATNFYRSITDPSQRVMFNGMAPDLKRAIGTFSASNPGAKVEFVTQGEGVYDRNTKTVMVNPNARNPLKPLLTHEFMHHMLNNGIGDGVVAQLVGDGYQTGGILRSKDGGYEQQYEEFKSEYVNRLRQQHERNIKLRDAIGDPVSKSERAFQVPDEKYLAEEYFIETNVDDMLGLVESGKLGKMAGRMVLNDKVRALGDAILNKSAILRDLHFRIGGVMDKQGKMVKGNGFLGGQLYQSPEIRRMFNKMVNESVGRRGGIDAAKMKARNGIELPISGKNDPILGEMSSLWESDADGNPLIDKNGDYIPLSKQTDELRSQAGMLLVDDLRARQSRGEAIPDGELAYNPENNTWSGQYLNDRQIELLSLSGRFNSKQIKQLKLMNESARATSDPNADPAARGHRFSVIYQPALKKNRKGQWRYDQIKPQLRDVVPYGVEISKDGNILIRIMSTNQLFANASEKAATKRGRSLYDGNMDSILRDANAIIDLHGKNQATDAYFKDKYGAQWASHKEFINSVFGNVGKGHKDINPLVASDRVDSVVKSYRLDRMNKATQLVGATQLPYQNNLIKINYLPEGEPILDANGEPKDLRYTPRYEERMPEQRQMPEVSPEDLNPVANMQEAQGLWADGKRMFALNEMDEKVTPITSKAMLDSYSADAIGWMEPEQAPAPSQRFMPEKLDADYMKAVESGDVGEQQRLVDEVARSSVKESYIPISKLKSTEKDQDKQVIDEIASKIKNPEDVDWDYYPALIVTPDMKVRDGHHRLQAFKKTKVEKARTLIVPYDIWKTAELDDNIDGLVKWAANAIDDPVTGNQPNLYGRPIKNIDPITRDDSGNIIPPSKRFDITSKDLRFMPEGERKVIDQNIPEKEGGNMTPSTWDSLKMVGYNPEASEKTQIATTAPTYESIVKSNATQGMEVLDFSAGRGIGTNAMKAIGKKIGFNVEGYEPFSNKKTRVVAPEYEGEDSINQIPDNSKDIIINNAVLNVVPESTGRQIVNQIYRKLKPGGSAFVNVMGWNNIKNRLDNPKTKLVGPREVITQKGTFQKGYTAQSLRSLIEQELPDAKIVRTSHGDIGFKVTKPAPPAETMPAINPPVRTGQMRFLPEPVEKLSAFKGKRVQVLTSDLSLVGDVKYGDYTASFKGGPGYLDNDGWAFTDKAAADAFVTRWKKDGEPLIGLASLGFANHLNSLDARKAYAEKWKYLVSSGEIGEELANDHIKQAMKRIISSDSKNVKPDWRNAAKMIESADDLSNYFDKIPWAAAPMFYSKLTAKTLPIKYKKLVELGLDLESAAKEYRQPEFEGAELGDLYAIAEYDGSTPEYKPELNKAYPWRIKFKKKATLSEMHNVAKLTTDPRAFAKKKVGGRLGAQPLMVTGINLDKLMSGDIAGSAKPLVLKPETAKTKSNKAKQFGSGNPEAYRSYQQILAERNAKKPKKKSTAKGNSSAIANATKLK